ncbi:MAG: SUMF1/EgtB/PvdO family nonheme iron enzyme, partial [Schleiferiaceae bacterium]
WEYAAYADGGKRIYNRVVDKNKYTWNGNATRNPDAQERGEILANFKRGRGDNMGTSGWLNDEADVTMQVRFYPPNDFGLYDMAGNVAEWVMDVYRPVSSYDVTDFRAFRGNEFKHYDKNYQDIGSLEVLQDPQKEVRNGDTVIVRLPGQLPLRDVTVEENVKRRNYEKADYRDYLDGDTESSQNYANPTQEGEAPMYDYGNKTLIGNTTRVYKGGSWKDRAYWLSPGTRRYLEEDQSTDYIGFRCAMDRVGFQNMDSKKKKRPTKVKRHNFKRYQM